MTERPNPDTDWLALADRLDKAFSDLRAAADGLRQYAAITAAIDTADGAQFARLDAERTKGEWVHRDVTQFVAGWDEATARLAASLSPTPTPDHDGHTIDVGPVTVHDDRCPTCGSDDPEVRPTFGRHGNYHCADAWHNSGAT